MVYWRKMTEIIDKISAKGALHRVHFMGNQDYFFEVSVRDKGAVGMGSSTVTMECQLWPETNTCVCFCNKPKLLHLPCSYVYAARGKAGIAGTYVSPYFLKEAVMATWSGELCGLRLMGQIGFLIRKLRSFTGVVERVVVLETIWTQRRLQVVRNFA